MKISGPLAPTNPFHLARAYGAVQAPANRTAAVSAGAASAGAASAGMVSAGAVTAAGPKTAQAVARLVAAVVPGGVDFDAPPARGSASAGGAGASASMELYRRPADRNTAATGVGLGRVIDVSG